MTPDALAAEVAAFGLPGRHPRFPAVPLDAEAWPAFLRALTTQRVLGHAGAAMRAGALPVTDDQRRALHRLELFVTSRVMWLDQGLLDVLDVLDAADVPVRVLKGPVVARAVYPDPHVRGYVDVDLLTPSGRFDDAVVALEQAGLRRVRLEPRRGFVSRFGKSVELRRQDGLSVDLHRTIAPGVFALKIDAGDLWQGTTDVTIAGRVVHGLGPTPRFLHACCHAVVGGTSPRTLVPLRDVVQHGLAPEHDPDAVLRMARRWTGEAVVAEAVTRAADVLGLDDETMPLLPWARAYRPTAEERRLLALTHDSEGRSARREVAAMVRAVPGAGGKARYLAALAFPSAAYRRSRGQGLVQRWARGVRLLRRPAAAGPTQKRRLLVVSTEFPPGPGGIATHAWQLARHAAREGWDVTVLALQDYVSVREAELFNVAQPFTVVRLQSRGRFLTRNLARMWTMWQVARYVEPDLVLASGSAAVWLSSVVPATRRCHYVAVGHGMEFGRKDMFSRLFNRMTYGRADAVVCVSEYTFRRMHQSGLRPRRATVIANGGDTELFVLPLEAPAPYPDDRVAGAHVLLTVGNVGERKGQDLVVRALPLLLARGIDVHYVVIGLPSRGRELAELAGQLGVADRLHVRGPVSKAELLRAYQAAHLFLMTSRQARNGDFEGYGIAVLEAALCGTPAVVTGDSGLAEAVIDGETGVVVPPEDPAAIAEAVARLLGDDRARAAMGRRARARTAALGSWHGRVDDYLRLFDSIVTGRG